MPRAEHFGDLITAGHKALSEESESHNNHRHAAVVQDLAIQWIQSYPCKSKSSRQTQKNLMKFLEPTRKPKVTHTDNSLESGKYCELSLNHCTSTPHRSETNGISEGAVHRVKEGTSAVLLHSDGKTFYESLFGMPFDGPAIPFEVMVEYHPVSTQDQSRLRQCPIEQGDPLEIERCDPVSTEAQKHR